MAAHVPELDSEKHVPCGSCVSVGAAEGDLLSCSQLVLCSLQLPGRCHMQAKWMIGCSSRHRRVTPCTSDRETSLSTMAGDGNRQTDPPPIIFQSGVSPANQTSKKGQFMNFSGGQSGTKVQCESCLFSQGKTPEFTEMGEIHELFRFGPFFGLVCRGRLLIQAPPSYGSRRYGFGVLRAQASILRDRCSVGALWGRVMPLSRSLF